MSEVERSESKATSSKDSGWTQARTLNTPEARRYCEWSLLVNDLKYALRRAEMWRDMAPYDAGDVGDIEISVSLFRDAVVSLVACFDDTSPVYLVPASVYGEKPGGAEYFQWLKNLRHTWIGHRGGPQRQCVVSVVLDESTGELRGFGCLQHVYLGPEAKAGDDLVRMMEIALAHARQELKKCYSVVEDYVKRMKNRERLKLPVATTTVPGHGEIHMGRRKFHNIKNDRKRKSPS